MSQNILIIVFGHSDTIKILLVSTGKSHDILATSQFNNFVDSDSLLLSFDQSLQEILPTSGQKPDLVALVLPYAWIDSDGKINKSKNQLISSLCQKHSLKPLGFISSDEAVLDYFNQEQGVPSSPILIDLSPDKVTVSLSDMGIIKKRLSQDIDIADSIPLICENIIVRLKDDFSPTPKIFVWGDFSRQTVLDFNNYAWVDKDKQDVFLHFPDIVFFDQKQIDNIFLDTINSQLIKDDTFTPATPEPESKSEAPIVLSQEDEPVQEPDKPDDHHLEQLSPSDLGFSSNSQTSKAPQLDTFDNFVLNQAPPSPEIIDQVDTRKKINFKLPHIKLPTRRFYFVMPSVILIPILLFIFFYKVNIDIFVTPLDLNLTKQVKIDPDLSSSSFDQNLIAVIAQENKLLIQDQINTTGSITVGDEAQGKVVIFNKTDQAVNLATGQILKTDSGISFQLLNDIQIDASSLDLDQGLIVMGKTVAVSEASDIGQQGNIVENTALFVDGFDESQLVARVQDSFAGGNSRQVASVAKEDQQVLEDKLKQKVDQNLSSGQPDQSNQYLLKSTVTTKQSNIEYTREIGEQADTLDASMEAVISYYSLIPDEIVSIVDFVSKSTEFEQAIDSVNSELTFDFIPKQDLSGNLSITGKASPQINFDTLRQLLTLKSNRRFVDILQSNIQRAYDFNLRSNSPFGSLPFLPLLKSNINLVVKTEI